MTAEDDDVNGWEGSLEETLWSPAYESHLDQPMIQEPRLGSL